MLKTSPALVFSQKMICLLLQNDTAQEFSVELSSECMYYCLELQRLLILEETCKNRGKNYGKNLGKNLMQNLGSFLHDLASCFKFLLDLPSSANF